MRISLAVAPNSIVLMGRGDPPTPNAPDIASVELVGSGDVGDELSYSVSYTTPPYPSPERFPQWRQDGVPMEGETGHTYTPTADDEGSLISVSLTVQNSEDSDIAVSNGIPIVFPAPVLADVSVSPGSGDVGDTFTASATVVGLGLTIGHQWELDGTPISGATGQTYQAVEAGTLTCVITASNSGDTVSEESNAVVVTYSEAPALLNVAIVPSSGDVGDGFVIDYDVTGVPTPDVTFAWEIDGTPVSGATNATFAPQTAGSLTCVVTATNGVGSPAVEESAAVTVSAITPGAPTISGIPDQSYDVDDGVQELDLSTYATGDNLVYAAIQTDNLTAISALVVEEGVGGTRDCSGAFPWSLPSTGYSYALTGASATFENTTDPREGITDADLPTGVSINATSGLVTVSSAAADMTATNFTVWKYRSSIVASQTLSLTITATPDDVWDITPGAETITVAAYPSVSTPTVDPGVETIERTA